VFGHPVRRYRDMGLVQLVGALYKAVQQDEIPLAVAKVKNPYLLSAILSS
jgi:hypothetical protein